jgi:formylglycine-generating enzyme required for sulfatase activity
MNKQFRKIGGYFLVVVCSVLLTSFTIDATDTLRSSQTALGILAKKATEVSCPADMVLVDRGEYSFCIDRYEAGVGEDCLVLSPKSPQDTAANANDPDCEPVSVAGELPWVNVNQAQAETLCAKAGKRLASAKEWYFGALGSIDDGVSCNLDGGSVSKTGSWSDCRSGVGAFDMVGNVWELVFGQVNDSVYQNRLLPIEGYVAEIDEDGLASRTALEPDAIFNNDYFWGSSYGRFILMRGGFFGSKSDGGLYAVHAKTETTFASGAVGFRCVLTI